MKNREKIEEMISQSEQSLKEISEDIKDCDSYELVDALIDRRIQEQTIISTLKWVLKD